MPDTADTRPRMLDTLAPYLRPRPLAALALGIASGFPLTLLLGTMTFWLAREGIDKKTIGFAVGLTTPYTLKFLWAPFIDRIRLPVLFVTGACPPEAMELAAGCLSKPYAQRDLLAAIGAIEAGLAGKPPKRLPPGFRLFQPAA